MTSPPVQPSISFVVAFVALVATMTLGFVWAVQHAGRSLEEAPGQTRRTTMITAICAALWLGGTGFAAAAGLLAFGPLPPRMIVLFIVMLLGLAALGLSRFGQRLVMGLPLALLVGFQAFRIPVEVLLHRAFEEGLAPVQMTYLGYNYDILTGLGAAIIGAALAAGRMPRWGVTVWNVLGVLLLMNVVTIAVLSAPGPTRVFTNEPVNSWVTTLPFVWLPTVLVALAAFGHILVARRLVIERHAQSASASPPPDR